MKLDFEKFISHVDLKITSKNKEEPEDAKLRRLKDKTLFFSMIGVMLVVMVTSLFFIFMKNSSYAGIAYNGLIGILSALTAYYVRGKNN